MEATEGHSQVDPGRVAATSSVFDLRFVRSSEGFPALAGMLVLGL
jgi:hypothetical protein